MAMKVTYSQITSLLQKFSPEELVTLIPHLFPNIGWDAVNNSIKKNRLSCQSKFIAKTTSTLYEASNPNKEEKQYIYWALEFYDKMYHNKQNWYGIHLIDQIEQLSETNQIEKSIIRAYRTEARDAEVMLKIDDDFIRVMTIEKKTSSNGVRFMKPFFFVHNYSLSEPFAFYYPKSPGCEDHINYCCKGLGYDTFEEIPLFGYDTNSLFGMLDRNINNSRALVPAKAYHPVTVVEEEGVVDFTLGRQRAKYAEDILPGNTNLQKYTVQAKNDWRGAPYLPDLEGIKIETAITFNSSVSSGGVENMFKEMIKRGMVHLPVPPYVANLPNTPKNHIILTEDDNELDETEE